MYNIYYNGELLHSDLTYQQGLEILSNLSKTEEYDPELIEMVEKN